MTADVFVIDKRVTDPFSPFDITPSFTSISFWGLHLIPGWLPFAFIYFDEIMETPFE